MQSTLPIVSRFEADLLTILQGFLGHVPRSQFLALLGRKRERPACLSRAAVELVQDTLAKGATLLVAQDGWRRERFLRSGKGEVGRVWERTPLAELGLTFSPASLDFLMWTTATSIEPPSEAWFPKKTLTLGDRWLLTVAFQSVEDSVMGRVWSQREPFRSEPLCQLLYAAEFERPAADPPLDFSPWLAPAGIAVLEAWQRLLADGWVRMERAKAQITTPQQLRAVAASQTAVLEAFLSAIDRIDRHDLARFLLETLGRLLAPGVALRTWITEARLGGLRLADRQQAYRDALVVIEQFQTLERWQAHARGVGYFDEDYQAAQLWKSDWEAYNGDRLASAARQLLDSTQWV